MTPVCTKTCSSCGYEGEVFTNSKRCPKCGEMTLALEESIEEEIEETPECGASITRAAPSCLIHLCRLPENHEMSKEELSDLHECACGLCWRKSKPNPEYKQAARLAAKYDLDWITTDSDDCVGVYEKRFRMIVGTKPWAKEYHYNIRFLEDNLEMAENPDLIVEMEFAKAFRHLSEASGIQTNQLKQYMTMTNVLKDLEG